MTKKVYLCGAINNCTDSECKDWRQFVKEEFKKMRIDWNKLYDSSKEPIPGINDFKCIDPMKRDFRGKEGDSVAQIVNGDYWDIENSDIVLAYADKPSWGTAMEIHHAFMNLGKYVVVFSNAEKPSPWLKYHCHHFCKTVEEAIEHLKGLD